MAGRNAQERFQILERRKRVAGMYLQGMKQWEIGRQLNVTQQCIAKDIQALEKECSPQPSWRLTRQQASWFGPTASTKVHVVRPRRGNCRGAVWPIGPMGESSAFFT